MDSKTPRPEALAAADWWAGRLTQPITHSLGRPGDRQASINTMMVNVAAETGRQQFTPEQVEAFRVALAERVEARIGADPATWRPDAPDWAAAVRVFGCDYGPDGILAEAAEQAGFRLSMFDLPMKTKMWVDPGRVRVAEGYGTEPVVIWQADWEEP